MTSVVDDVKKCNLFSLLFELCWKLCALKSWEITKNNFGK